MSDYRIFRFAHAGVLVALVHAAVSNTGGKFDDYIWLAISVALPTTVFRGLIAGHPKENLFKAASGVAGWLSYVFTIAAFGFTFANYSKSAAFVFAAISLYYAIILRSRSRP
jgi:uncharacterized membrane protein YjjB (DUF3815 family)